MQKDGIYTGYIKDLMDRVSEVVGFQYEFYLVRDNYYGTRDENGTWSGIVGDIIQKVS